MRRLAYLVVVALALSAGGCGAFSAPSKKGKAKKPPAEVTRPVQRRTPDPEPETTQKTARDEETQRMAEIRSYMERGKQDIESALAKELARETVEIEMIDDRTMRLTLNNTASFDIGGSKLSMAAINALHNLAVEINALSKINVSIVGHTDSSGRSEANLVLSQRRADAVMASLAKHGVPNDRMVAEGRGDQEPRDTNATADGRTVNRRVDIWLRYVDN